MIASVCATIALAAVLLAVQHRRHRARVARLHAAHLAIARRDRAESDRRRDREFLARLAAEVDADRLRAWVEVLTQDRDALQIVAADNLRRAWRAERQLADRPAPVVVLAEEIARDAVDWRPGQ